MEPTTGADLRVLETQLSRQAAAPTMRGVEWLNARHEAVMQWLVLNPGRKLKECAIELGYTQAWLSQIIHSDAFQVEYRRRCREAGMIATFTIQARMGRIVEKAMDVLEERIEAGEMSERGLIETSNSMLEKLGYTAKPQVQEHKHEHSHVVARAEDIRAGREILLAKQGASDGVVVEPDPKVG